jgi:RNA recognition motif. (a.k.a. RRM, RBD, or RNP domain)
LTLEKVYESGVRVERNIEQVCEQPRERKRQVPLGGCLIYLAQSRGRGSLQPCGSLYCTDINTKGRYLLLQTYTKQNFPSPSRDCIFFPTVIRTTSRSVSMFANALRTHSRFRVLTATRVALPATRGITSLVAFRTAAPKDVSLSVSRSFTTTQLAREESQLAPKELEGSQVATEVLEDSQVAAHELENPQVAIEGLEDSQLAPKEFEDSQVATEKLEGSQVSPKDLEDPQVAPKELEDSQVAPKDLEDGAPRAPLEPSSNTIFVASLPMQVTDDDVRQTFSQFGEIKRLKLRAYFFSWPFSINCVFS